ncbi:MAG TPA: hypothetical protein VFN10_23385 [Thermoanaerobaculia bacterium]|nr:hypothetical protein [Thermoanaerobaculia bacterium]
MRLSSLPAIALLAAACSSSSLLPAVPAPQWDVVPAGVVDALCSRLRADAVASGTIAIVSTTQPLATNESLGALGHATQKRADAMRAAEALRTGGKAIPLTIHQGSCDWQPLAAPSHQADQLVVELSAPIPNPFANQESGMFARVSLAGDSATWYWIPLGSRGGVWAVGNIMPLVM